MGEHQSDDFYTKRYGNPCKGGRKDLPEYDKHRSRFHRVFSHKWRSVASECFWIAMNLVVWGGLVVFWGYLLSLLLHGIIP